MPYFEKEILDCIANYKGLEIIENNFNKYENIDLILKYKINTFGLEVKEKKRQYTKVWSDISGFEEKDIFIVDELGARKMFELFPNISFLYLMSRYLDIFYILSRYYYVCQK